MKTFVKNAPDLKARELSSAARAHADARHTRDSDLDGRPRRARALPASSLESSRTPRGRAREDDASSSADLTTPVSIGGARVHRYIIMLTSSASSIAAVAPRAMAPPRRRAARAPRDVAMVARAAADAEDAPVAAAPPIGRDVTFGRRAEMLRAKKESSRDLDANDAAGFWGKIKAAFAIFFPPSEEETARIEAKKRLRMILVADRCAMSGAAMQAMKEKIVDVVREFAEVDDELGVEVSMSQVRVHVASLSTTYQYTSSHTHQS